jgi:hypothetical protein
MINTINLPRISAIAIADSPAVASRARNFSNTLVDRSLLMRYRFGQLSDIVAVTQWGQLARYTKPERYGNPCMINTINLPRISAIAIADCHEYLV